MIIDCGLPQHDFRNSACLFSSRAPLGRQWAWRHPAIRSLIVESAPGMGERAGLAILFRGCTLMRIHLKLLRAYRLQKHCHWNAHGTFSGFTKL